jgi:hypothetical protein
MTKTWKATKTRNATLAAAGALALLAAGCGSEDSCPRTAGITDAAGFNPPPACTVPSTTLTIPVQLCEQCSHTAPNCAAEVVTAPTETLPGEIFLSTQWEVCEDNKSCSANACASASCSVTVPGPGAYDVVYITGMNQDGSFQTEFFEVTFGAGGTSTCTT